MKSIILFFSWLSSISAGELAILNTIFISNTLLLGISIAPIVYAITVILYGMWVAEMLKKNPNPEFDYKEWA